MKGAKTSLISRFALSTALMAAVVVLLAAIFFHYFKGDLFTAYQVLEQRFGGATKRMASVLFLVTRNLADGLRQSSDELTRMARTFVVTGDPAYEQHFNSILAIRNGTEPRPQGYGGIYWDFVVAGGQEPAAIGAPVASNARTNASDSAFERP